MTAPPEFPGIRTLTASEMFALDLNATALAEESPSLIRDLQQEHAMSEDPSATDGDPGPQRYREEEADAIGCPCGESHDIDPAITRMITVHGPVSVMRGPDGAWHVPRVFAAAHDVTAEHLREAAEQYGFESA